MGKRVAERGRGERKRSERFSWCEHCWRGDGKIIESRLSHRRTKEIFHRPTNFLAKWPCIKIAGGKEGGKRKQKFAKPRSEEGSTMQRKSEARIKNSSIDKYDDNNNNNRRKTPFVERLTILDCPESIENYRKLRKLKLDRAKLVWMFLILNFLLLS